MPTLTENAYYTRQGLKFAFFALLALIILKILSNVFARNLEFDADPISLSPALYQWTDPDYPLRTLQKDIFTGNFTLRFDFYKDLSVLKEGSLPYGKAAISEATGFLEV